jgi:thiol-disulfide isomerase/thioredoxin
MRTIAVLLCVYAASVASGQVIGDQTALSLYAATHKKRASQTEPARQQRLAGRVAPPLAVERWMNAATEPQFRNRVVLIDFWSMNCAPCVANFPRIAALAARLRDRGGIVVTIHPDTVGVKEQGLAGRSVWSAKPAAPLLESFLKAKQFTLPVGIDSRESLAYAYALDGWPTYFLLDRRGVVRWESHLLPTDQEISTVESN